MRFRSAATSVFVVLLSACGASEVGGIPTGDHVHSLAVTADGGLLMGLHGGLYRSSDGEGWESAGLSGKDAMAIATARAGDPVFVAGHDVLYRSDDGGESFSSLTPDDLPGLDIHGFAQASSDARAVYAFVVGHGLFASRDAGETWDARASIEELPRDAFGMAVAGSDDMTVVMVGPDSGVHRSVDGGRSFERVLEVPSLAVTVDRNSPDLVWALTVAGLARSENAGQSWEIASTLDGVEGQPVAIAAEGTDLWLVAEQPRTVYNSTDSGGSWLPMDG